MPTTDLQPFLDGLQSLVSGMGDPTRDKSASTAYVEETITDETISAIYRSSWIARKTVTIPALDAFRRWREWQGDKDQIPLIEAQEAQFNVQQKLLRTNILARLWGGAALFIGTNQPSSQPLDTTLVQRNGLRFLTVFSRRDLQTGDLDADPRSEFYGRPAYYELHPKEGTTPVLRIHPSHLVVFIGEEYPDPWQYGSAVRGWGDSVIQSAFNSIKNADATASNIASMVFEANVDVFGVPDMLQNLGNPDYEQRLLTRFALANAAKGINKALLHDSDETYERKQLSFVELPKVLELFLLIMAGASDIPITRFLGQSPSGLTSSGEGDMKNYYDRVTSMQSLEISPAIKRLDDVLIRSSLGSRPDNLWYKWAPLEQMNTRQISEIAKLYSETLRFLKESNVMLPKELRQLAINQFVEQGIFPGIEKITESTGEDQFHSELIEILSEIAEAEAGSPEDDPQQKASTKRKPQPSGNSAKVRMGLKDPGPNT